MHLPRCFPILVSASVLCAGLLLAPAQANAQRTLNVYNWSDYIAPGIIEAFTKETGIRVKYDTFDSNDTLETRLLAGQSGYDVVVPTGYFLERQIKAKVFLPLDRAKIPNLVHVWPEVASRLAAYDPGNRHAVNYMWGTTGIGYNVARAREILGKDLGKDLDVAEAMASWDIVFDPKSLARFAKCGVHMLDSPDDILSAAMKHLGLDPNSKAPGDLEQGAALLSKIRPSVLKFHSSEYLNALATGEICLVVGWSGDIKQAQARAEEAKGNVEIGYAIPKQGAQMWFDNLAIPRDARNVDEAHAFIDFLMRPDVAARNTAHVAYPNGNLTSQKHLDKDILEDRSIYPDEATMKGLYTISANDQKTQRLINRLWTRVKTGR